MSVSVNVGTLVQAPPAGAAGLAFEQRIQRSWLYSEGGPYLPLMRMRPIDDRGVQGGEPAARGVRA